MERGEGVSSWGVMLQVIEHSRVWWLWEWNCCRIWLSWSWCPKTSYQRAAGCVVKVGRVSDDVMGSAEMVFVCDVLNGWMDGKGKERCALLNQHMKCRCCWARSTSVNVFSDQSGRSFICTPGNLMMLTTSTALLLMMSGEWLGCFLLKSMITPDCWQIIVPNETHHDVSAVQTTVDLGQNKNFFACLWLSIAVNTCTFIWTGL